MEQKKHIGTLCVQAGWTPKNGESRVLPIIQSTTFKYDNSEEMGFVAWLCSHHTYKHRRYCLRDDRHHQELESVEPIFIA